MRISGSIFSRKLPVVMVSTFAALLVGCSEDPGLQEKLVRMQAELQQKTRELEQAQTALQKAQADLKTASPSATPASADSGTASAAPASGSTLTREQLEESYVVASKELKRRVEGETKGIAVNDFTSFPVVMPSSSNPYTSKIALTVQADGARNYRLEFPVNADTTGKWNFPGPPEVSAALADSRAQEQKVAASQGTAAAPRTGSAPMVDSRLPVGVPSNISNPAGRTSGQTFNGPPVSETRVIDWGDRSASHSAPRPVAPVASVPVPPAPAPEQPQAAPVAPEPSAPQPSRAPAANPMAADKDVRIHW